MDIPPHLLPQVTCSTCGDFLARSPVLVLTDGRSICGHHDVDAPQNSAYEALAQMMRFPCKFRPRGCSETPLWNSEHEDECVYSDVEPEREHKREKALEKCYICQGNIYELPRYECCRGHKICPMCATPNNFRCQLCKSKISNELIYLCKYSTLGCKFKSNKDQVIRHETDCDSRGFNCPFLTHDCKWIGSLNYLPQHLKTKHFEGTVLAETTKRTFRMKDDTWVMVAHGEVFQCYCWIEESAVEWLAKYVGSQEKCCLYSCEVRLCSKTDKSILKMTSKCHGWNNVSLEKCIQVSNEKMSKYSSGYFQFTILKN